MTGADRNKQTVWFATLTDDGPVRDEWGNVTSHRVVYGNPQKTKAALTPGSGRVATGLFGLRADYSKVMGPLPNDCGIDETTILWVDKEPVIEADGSTRTGHDYVVRHVSRSINHVNFAIDKVSVGDAE